VIAKKISVLAVDDHPLLRQGVASILESADDIELIGQAQSGEEALEAYRALMPDVTLMDIQMPGIGGLEALHSIRNEFPNALVIMLTVYRDESQIRKAIKTGAAGYLLKSMVQKELRDAIRVVNGGGKYIPAQIAVGLATSDSEDVLSDSEVAVLRLVANGFSNRSVATALEVPEETVKSRMKSILTKLAANDRTHAVTIAVKRGIIDL